MSNKIFCIGVQRTGTTSLKKALRILGYTVSTSRVDLLPIFVEGDFDKLIPIVNNFDALQDTPWYLCYKFLDKEYPGSKFIVTVRPVDSWLKSMYSHFDHTDREDVLAMQEFIYGYKRPSQNEDAYIEVFKNHYKNIEAHFE